MPRKTTTTKKTTTPRATKKDQEALMEFEQFISQSPAKQRGGGGSKGWLAATLIVIIVILGAAWLFMSRTPEMQRDLKFKAVYLDNGQTYYAKVVQEDALNIYLDEVYYIQTEQMTVPAEEEGGEPQVVTVPVLVKRGQELHQPEGYMQVNRDKLVAIEVIGEGSEIIAEIERLNQ